MICIIFRPETAANLDDAKEGIVDALLNLTWQRASGAGPEGEMIFGAKPSLRFVSGILLPRFEESGEQDETSDIHISAHGLDCQIAASARGNLVISVSFSIYVRTLPTWDELTKPELELFPNLPLRRDLEAAIREAMRERMTVARAAEEGKPADQRRPRRDLQQQIYRELLGTHGVEVSSDDWIVDAGVNPEQAGGTAESDSSDQSATAEDGPRLVSQRGRYIFHRDEAAQEIDIPQKWKRLPVELAPLSVDTSNAAAVQVAVETWTKQMREGVVKATTAWIETEEGRNWAYRAANIRPSHIDSNQTWNDFLSTLRSIAPSVKELGPDLSGLVLTVQFDDDLRDPDRRNMRVMLENNSNEVRKRLRHRFDHSIHQVGLAIELPTQAHRALKLDRVEPSYRFRDFLSYPAIGINCGVSEARIGDRLRLTTTWMPRYQQPRIVPTDIKGVPTDFATLGAENFDPARIRPRSRPTKTWIRAEEQNLDPAAGVEGAIGFHREREQSGATSPTTASHQNRVGHKSSGARVQPISRRARIPAGVPVSRVAST